MARKMVRRVRLSERIGPWPGAARAPSSSVRTHAHPRLQRRHVPGHRREVERILRERRPSHQAPERAQDGLQLVADALVEKETIDGGEVGRLVDKPTAGRSRAHAKHRAARDVLRTRQWGEAPPTRDCHTNYNPSFFVDGVRPREHRSHGTRARAAPLAANSGAAPSSAAAWTGVCHASTSVANERAASAVTSRRPGCQPHRVASRGHGLERWEPESLVDAGESEQSALVEGVQIGIGDGAEYA